MAMRVEATLFGPDTQQYAAQGQARITLEQIAERAALLEKIGFDGVTTAEAGHDAFLPIMTAAASTKRLHTPVKTTATTTVHHGAMACR